MSLSRERRQSGGVSGRREKKPRRTKCSQLSEKQSEGVVRRDKNTNFGNDGEVRRRTGSGSIDKEERKKEAHQVALSRTQQSNGREAKRDQHQRPKMKKLLTIVKNRAVSGTGKGIQKWEHCGKKTIRRV